MVVQFDMGDAVGDARRDWADHTARYRTIGRMDSRAPQLGKSAIFYTVSIGCEASAAAESYCTLYNAELDALVARHGVPRWAPSERIPSRQTCIDALEKARDEVDDVQAERAEWIRRQRKREGIETALVAVDDEKRVAILGGSRGKRAGVVDIVDLEDGAYMERFEYRRRHIPVFPWDHVARSDPSSESTE